MICTVDHVADGAVQIRSGILGLFLQKLLCILDHRAIDVLAITLRCYTLLTRIFCESVRPSASAAALTCLITRTASQLSPAELTLEKLVETSSKKCYLVWDQTGRHVEVQGRAMRGGATGLRKCRPAIPERLDFCKSLKKHNLNFGNL